MRKSTKKAISLSVLSLIIGITGLFISQELAVNMGMSLLLMIIGRSIIINIIYDIKYKEFSKQLRKSSEDYLKSCYFAVVDEYRYDNGYIIIKDDGGRDWKISKFYKNEVESDILSALGI